jgi:hypothetical protein
LRKYRVFICHAWEYSADYYRIVDFLNEAPFFEWEDCSVPVHDPLHTRDLEYELRNQMRDADVFLIIAGMYAAHHDWMDFELRFARRIGRPILGILTWGSERVPQTVQAAAVELVGWNSASIVAAIRRHARAHG